MHYILWAAGIATLIVQYFISKQRITIFGAILPTAYMIFIIWLVVNWEVPATTENIVPLSLGLVLLLSGWINGKEAYKKKQKKEMDKMKGKDLSYTC
ncbi:hypothetical protein [Bacillus piscicola]|uniref:hypothetical protein n=1 Tax=Bacillus piscicola TaxID=1632684 RepID=UPI001F099C33|nr:hypothetical protein [Bacillus piscicola]